MPSDQSALPIVFLPGGSGVRAQWEPVAARLPGREHIIVDYPGFNGVPANGALRSLSDLYDDIMGRLPARFDLVAQSMGGVMALRAALEQPERIRRLVLVATSGGMDVRKLGGIDWRPAFLARLAHVPRWFVDDRTDLTAKLPSVRAPTLLIFGDTDDISPVAVGEQLRDRLPDARLETIAGGTHDMTTDVPDVVARLIGSHLDAT
jgi:poly(3-hydroxyoctanoate) depolymerase